MQFWFVFPQCLRLNFFHVSIGHLYFFLSELSTLLTFLSSLYIVDKTSVRWLAGKACIPFCWLPLHSVSCFLCCIKAQVIFSMQTTSEMHFLRKLCLSCEYYVEKASVLIMTVALFRGNAMYLPMSDLRTAHYFIIRMISRHLQNQRVVYFHLYTGHICIIFTYII